MRLRTVFPGNPWANPLVLLAACLFIALFAGAFFFATKPSYSTGTWIAADGAQGGFEFPFYQEKGPKTGKQLDFTMRLGRLSPTHFTFFFRDLLFSVEINSRPAFKEERGYEMSRPTGEDMAPWLHDGDNTVRVKFRSYWRESSFHWIPSLSDPWTLFLLGLSLTSLACGLRWVQVVRPTWLENKEAILLFLFLGLRLVYSIGTPFSVRAYDWLGHLEYAQYVARNLSLPPHDFGWETGQPPLFYVLFGLAGRLAAELGGSSDTILAVWQIMAFGIAALTLVLVLWLARLLFPGRDNNWRLCFFSCVAALPGLAFFSTRTNNDILQALISFAFVGACLSFWRDSKWRSWMAISVLVGLGLLTKINSLVYLPVVALALLLTPGMAGRRKVQLILAFSVVVSLIAGWSMAGRALERKDSTSFVVSNTEQLVGQDIVPTVEKFTAFNPIEMIRQPFMWVGHNPRFDRFLEFFFKTALFSESLLYGSYQTMARVILVCALVLLGFAIPGAWHAMRTGFSPGWLLMIIFAGFFSAQMLGVILVPYACHQNFRLSAITAIPAFFFSVKGIEISPDIWKRVGTMISMLFVGTSCAFLIFQPRVLK